MTLPVTRRRALAILAASAGVASARLLSASPSYAWTGTALGADATLLFETSDRSRADAAVARCLEEVERLERIFSLMQPESELCRLNREGRLVGPSLDLCLLLGVSRRLHAATDGLFDPTVQPLWRHYAEQALGLVQADPDVASYVTHIGFDRVHIDPGEIRLAPGMALTLNGIAQGYVTDRVADLLQQLGWHSVLVDLGEVRALEGRAFDVRVGASGNVVLENGALATSETSGTLIGPGSGISHVLDPRTGAPARLWRRATVRHASAAVADGLSTALLLAEAQQAQRIVARIPGATAWLGR